MLFFTILVTVIAALALRGFIVMLLWNWLMPMLTSLPEIGFFEAVGLFLLASFLMGSVVDKNVIPSTKKAPTK